MTNKRWLILGFSIFGTTLFLSCGILAQVMITTSGLVGFDLWAAHIIAALSAILPTFFTWFAFFKQIK